jgi:hypothetical protein
MSESLAFTIDQDLRIRRFLPELSRDWPLHLQDDGELLN